MIFETKQGRYWPIDQSAEEVTQRFQMLPPMDWQSYEALLVFMREAGENIAAVELWDSENPFGLEPYTEDELSNAERPKPGSINHAFGKLGKYYS